MKRRTYDREGRLLSEEEVELSPPTSEERNAQALRERIEAALETNRVFVSQPGPTPAQTSAQVKQLTRETSAIIRILLGRLEEID